MANNDLPKNDDDHAIVIGIDGYVALRPLKAAKSDATKFVEWLKSPTGGHLPVDNIHLIVSPAQRPTDPFDAEPVQRDIDRTLRDMGVLQGKRIGRRLYFYFAGHGYGPQWNNVGMLMAGASEQQLGDNLGLSAYRTFFRETPFFDEVIFILDCCRDPLHHPHWGAPIFTTAPRVTEVKDCVVLAAPWGKKAFAPTNRETGERRGLLTQALIEGLNGAAADPNGRVRLALLGEYIRKRVPDIAGEAQLKQAPEVDDTGSEDLVLATVPVESNKIAVSIIAHPSLTGQITLRDHRNNIVDERPADAATESAPWQIPLDPNTLFRVVHAETQKDVLFSTDGPGPITVHVPAFNAA